MIVVMTGEQARSEIATWTRHSFRLEGEQMPEIEVLDIAYHEEEEEWSAALYVSNSVDDPTVVFWKDDRHGLQIDHIDCEKEPEERANSRMKVSPLPVLSS